jgi:hypothetical protein
MHWGLADYVFAAFVVSAPGIAAGAGCGALVWPGRRWLGAALGAAAGWALAAAAFLAWSDTKVSLTKGFGDAARITLLHGLPGLLAGAAIGAALRWGGRSPSAAHPRPIWPPAIWGALAGGVVWLGGWWGITGGL